MSPNTTPRAATVRAAVRLRPTEGIACTDIWSAGLSFASPPEGQGQRGIAPAGAQVNLLFDIFAEGLAPGLPPNSRALEALRDAGIDLVGDRRAVEADIDADVDLEVRAGLPGDGEVRREDVGH